MSPSSAQLASFWKSESLRSVAFVAEKGNINDDVLRVWRNAKPGEFFPEAIALSLSVDLGPGCFGRHNGLCILALIPRICNRGWLERGPYWLGSGPSETVSGLLARWVVDLLQAMPRLHVLITHIDRAKPDDTGLWWKRASYRMEFRTFSNGIDTLYYARYYGEMWDDERYLIGPHFMSYTSVNMESSDDFSWGEKGWGWQDPGRFPSSLVTFYRGYPIPFSLLQHVFWISEHLPDSQTFARDLELVDEAWELLDAWWEDVEKEKEQHGDVDVRERLTAPDLYDMLHGKCIIHP